MTQATMVYRSPATKPHTTCVDRKTGQTYETKVVDAEPAEEGGKSELDQALESGWYGSPAEAIDAATGKVEPEPAVDFNAPPTRAELEQKASELGVVFDDKMKDKTLSKKINQVIETHNQPMGEFL